MCTYNLWACTAACRCFSQRTTFWFSALRDSFQLELYVLRGTHEGLSVINPLKNTFFSILRHLTELQFVFDLSSREKKIKIKMIYFWYTKKNLLNHLALKGLYHVPLFSNHTKQLWIRKIRSNKQVWTVDSCVFICGLHSVEWGRSGWLISHRFVHLYLSGRSWLPGNSCIFCFDWECVSGYTNNCLYHFSNSSPWQALTVRNLPHNV